MNDISKPARPDAGPAESLRLALAQVIATQRALWRSERAAMDAEMREAVAAFRDRLGRLPKVAAWSNRIYRECDLVEHAGSTWQAARDTAQAPPHDDWVCIARAGRDGANGRAMNVRGTWDSAARYGHLDVVILNGASFVALHDNPGACPGPGWQLLAAQGKRGRNAPGVVRMTITDDGVLTLLNADGTAVTLDLYPLLSKVAQARAAR